MRVTAAEVYEELAPAVLGFFRGHRVADPEDLTGDVFVRVSRNLDQFRGDAAALRRWVFTIAHHRLVDEYRRAGRTREIPVADVPEHATDQVGALDPSLLRALERLTVEQREVLVLRFVADMPLRDVAKIVGKRTGAVKMLQSRGLEELRSILLKWGEE